MEKRRQPEVIAGRVNSDGSIATGDGFTVTKTGTGAYTITLNPGFRLIGVSALAISNATGIWGGNVVPGERSFGITTTTSNTGVAVDGGFSFVAVGIQV